MTRCYTRWGATGLSRAHNLMHQYRLWGWIAWKQLCRKGTLVDINLTTSQLCALTAKKANGLLGCIRQSIGRYLRTVAFPLYPAQWGSIWRAVCSSKLPSSSDIDVLQSVQGRAARMIKGLEHLLNKEQISELGQLSLEKRRFRRFLSVCVMLDGKV